MPFLGESQQHTLQDIGKLLLELRQLIDAQSKSIAKFGQQSLTEEAPNSLDTRSPQQPTWHTRPPDVQPTTSQESAGRWRPPPSLTVADITSLEALEAQPYMRTEAPLFNGDDPLGWIFGIQAYFNYFFTDESVRLAVVEKLIEQPASDWFYYYQQTNVDGSWEDFLVAVRHRFAPELIEDDVLQVVDEKQDVKNEITDNSPSLPSGITKRVEVSEGPSSLTNLSTLVGSSVIKIVDSKTRFHMKPFKEEDTNGKCNASLSMGSSLIPTASKHDNAGDDELGHRSCTLSRASNTQPVHYTEVVVDKVASNDNKLEGRGAAVMGDYKSANDVQSPRCGTVLLDVDIDVDKRNDVEMLDFSPNVIPSIEQREVSGFDVNDEDKTAYFGEVKVPRQEITLVECPKKRNELPRDTIPVANLEGCESSLEAVVADGLTTPVASDESTSTMEGDALELYSELPMSKKNETVSNLNPILEVNVTPFESQWDVGGVELSMHYGTPSWFVANDYVDATLDRAIMYPKMDSGIILSAYFVDKVIVKKFDWKEVVIGYEDNNYERGLVPYLRMDLLKSNALVSHRSVISSMEDYIRLELSKLTKMHSKLMKMQPRVFVVHMLPGVASDFSKVAKEVRLMDKGYAWMMAGVPTYFLIYMDPTTMEAMHGGPGNIGLQNFSVLLVKASQLKKDQLEITQTKHMILHAKEMIERLLDRKASMFARELARQTFEVVEIFLESLKELFRDGFLSRARTVIAAEHDSTKELGNMFECLKAMIRVDVVLIFISTLRTRWILTVGELIGTSSTDGPILAAVRHQQIEPVRQAQQQRHLRSIRICHPPKRKITPDLIISYLL